MSNNNFSFSKRFCSGISFAGRQLSILTTLSFTVSSISEVRQDSTISVIRLQLAYEKFVQPNCLSRFVRATLKCRDQHIVEIANLAWLRESHIDFGCPGNPGNDDDFESALPVRVPYRPAGFESEFQPVTSWIFDNTRLSETAMLPTSWDQG